MKEEGTGMSYGAEERDKERKNGRRHDEDWAEEKGTQKGERHQNHARRKLGQGKEWETQNKRDVNGHWE